ncbi:unnamed protein product [Dovyalis caffra]|uniref:Uncharacterized protein n=1 Tax=Dovyalis caffra TaxID=77055 RepID=A0AAV1QU94_9ROSI|nr:unnamed protein product [Dovyalis caffra]
MASYRCNCALAQDSKTDTPLILILARQFPSASNHQRSRTEVVDPSEILSAATTKQQLNHKVYRLDPSSDSDTGNDKFGNPFYDKVSVLNSLDDPVSQFCESAISHAPVPFLALLDSYFILLPETLLVEIPYCCGISSSPVKCSTLWHMIWNWQLVACLMIEAFPVEALNSIQHLNGSVDEMEAYTGINSIPYHIVSQQDSIHSGDWDCQERNWGLCQFEERLGVCSG